MPAEKLYSSAEAAEMIGKDKTNLNRVAKRIKVGQQIGRNWAFTAAEVQKLAAAWGNGPGSPLFTEGNEMEAKAIAKRWRTANRNKKGAE